MNKIDYFFKIEKTEKDAEPSECDHSMAEGRVSQLVKLNFTRINSQYEYKKKTPTANIMSSFREAKQHQDEFGSLPKLTSSSIIQLIYDFANIFLHKFA